MSATSSTNGGAGGPDSKAKAKASATQKGKRLQRDEEDSGSVLSLVGSSSGSDVDSVKEGSSKRTGKSITKKAAGRAATKAKGKGKAKDEEVEVLSVRKGDKKKKKRASGSRARKVVSTTDEDDSDDDDDVVVSEAGSSTSLPLPRSTKSRQATPLAGPSIASQTVARTASGSAILDLTDSPPRPRPSGSPKRKRDKLAPTSTTTSGFAPLAEMYGAAREKRRKGQEGIEPRWPTAEEHVGWWPVARAPERNAYIGARDKGKGKAEVGLDDADLRDGDRDESLLARYKRSYEEAGRSGEQAPAYQTILRPLSSLPFLLPSPLPSHPLLDRLAAPFRAGRMPDRQKQGADTIWTTKYAPLTAEEVLGTTSGQSAIWLKEWLEELKVVGASESNPVTTSAR